jgi:hypothetical protein
MAGLHRGLADAVLIGDRNDIRLIDEGRHVQQSQVMNSSAYW